MKNPITIAKSTNLFGKKRNLFVATLGSVMEENKDKEQAYLGLLNKIEKQFENLFARKYLAKGNVVFCLYYANGWTYDILHLDTMQSGCCMMGNITRQRAIEHMENHFNSHDGK